MAKDGLTPMMKQFYDLKARHPDAVLLFRCGDFYETYGEDAVAASGILGITLTRRNNGKENMPDRILAEELMKGILNQSAKQRLLMEADKQHCKTE